MSMMRALAVAISLLAFLAVSPAFAVNPDEVLADPKLETRARALSSELRCLVCQNQSIDDSDAPLARDLRVIVREKLKAGAGDDEIKRFLVDRYGEFVLLRPALSLHTALLWGGPFLVLLGGLVVVWSQARRRRPGFQSPLSVEERTALERMTGPGPGA
jgi:cytochrome c-type biogenesis protein CcmH